VSRVCSVPSDKHVFIIFVKKTHVHSTVVVLQKLPKAPFECYKSNDSFDKVEYSFDVVAGVDGA